MPYYFKVTPLLQAIKSISKQEMGPDLTQPEHTSD